MLVDQSMLRAKSIFRRRTAKEGTSLQVEFGIGGCNDNLGQTRVPAFSF